MTNPVNRLRLAVAWLIVVVWVASIVVDALVPSYDAPATIHGLMLIVAGFLFGPTITGRGKENPYDSDINR